MLFKKKNLFAFINIIEFNLNMTTITKEVSIRDIVEGNVEPFKNYGYTAQEIHEWMMQNPYEINQVCALCVKFFRSPLPHVRLRELSWVIEWRAIIVGAYDARIYLIRYVSRTMLDYGADWVLNWTDEIDLIYFVLKKLYGKPEALKIKLSIIETYEFIKACNCKPNRKFERSILFYV